MPGLHAAQAPLHGLVEWCCRVCAWQLGIGFCSRRRPALQTRMPALSAALCASAQGLCDLMHDAPLGRCQVLGPANLDFHRTRRQRACAVVRRTQSATLYATVRMDVVPVSWNLDWREQCAYIST